MSLIKHLTNGLLTVTSLAYPLIWLLTPEKQGFLALIPIIMAVLWAIKAIQAVKFQRFFAIFFALLLALIGITRSLESMYWYPVIINAVMLALFGGSLFTQQPIIERLARLTQPNLPPEGGCYTRKVTQVWCGFFILNGGITTYLILSEQLQAWAIYSGVISYALMGGLFVAEWAYRQFIIEKK